MENMRGLKARLIASFEQSLGKRPLPALLTRRQVDQLGVRKKPSLDRDACVGYGLLPFPQANKRGKALYLLDDVVSYALGMERGTAEDASGQHTKEKCRKQSQ